MPHAASHKAHKRQLAELRRDEQRCSTWLVRISLFLLVLGWAYGEYVASSSSSSSTGRTTKRSSTGARQSGVSSAAFDTKTLLLGAGAVYEGHIFLFLQDNLRAHASANSLGAVHLSLKWYFMRKRRPLGQFLRVPADRVLLVLTHRASCAEDELLLDEDAGSGDDKKPRRSKKPSKVRSP